MSLAGQDTSREEAALLAEELRSSGGELAEGLLVGRGAGSLVMVGEDVPLPKEGE